MIDRKFIAIVAAAALLGGLLAALWLGDQEERYSATATAAIAPSPGLLADADLIDVVTSLERGGIPATAAGVAGSRSVYDAAVAAIGLDPAVAGDYDVDAVPVLGANLVDVSVTGPDPQAAADMANAVAAQLAAGFTDLYRVYEVRVVTAAVAADSAGGPSALVAIAAAAVVAGLAAALVMSTRRERLRRPTVVQAVEA